MELSDLKLKLKECLPKSIEDTINELKKELNKSANLYDDLLIIESNFNLISTQFSNNLITSSEHGKEFSKITKSILGLINSIREEDRKNFSKRREDEFIKVRRGYNCIGIPADFLDSFKEVFGDGDLIKQIAFCVNEGWIILLKSGGVAYSRISEKLADELKKADNFNKKIKRITLSHVNKELWIILFEDNSFIASRSIPNSLIDQLDKSINQNEIIRSVSISSKSRWVIIYESGNFSSYNIPEDLRNEMNYFYDHGEMIKEVVFGPSNIWIVVSHFLVSSSKNVMDDLSEKFKRMDDLEIRLFLVAISSNKGWVIIEEKLADSN